VKNEERPIALLTKPGKREIEKKQKVGEPSNRKNTRREKGTARLERLKTHHQVTDTGKVQEKKKKEINKKACQRKKQRRLGWSSGRLKTPGKITKRSVGNTVKQVGKSKRRQNPGA